MTMQAVSIKIPDTIAEYTRVEDEETPAQKFLKLSWTGNESAGEILSSI